MRTRKPVTPFTFDDSPRRTRKMNQSRASYASQVDAVRGLHHSDATACSEALSRRRTRSHREVPSTTGTSRAAVAPLTEIVPPQTRYNLRPARA